MMYKVLLALKDAALLKRLAHEIRTRRIPCRISIFQSIPALIGGNSFDYADAVLIDAPLLSAGALTESLLRGAMGRHTVVFGSAMNERTARILAGANVQCRPATENERAMCDVLEAVLSSGRNAGSLSETLWQALTAYGADQPAPKFFPEQILHRIRREVRRMK